MEMITAKEAKQLAWESEGGIDLLIQHAAMAGRLQIELDYIITDDELVDTLRANGYQVYRNRFGTKISWW